MEILRIVGGNRLQGDIEISGSKNAALPQFAATLLSQEKSIISNVPNLSDVKFMAEILSELGAAVTQIDYDTWEIDPANINKYNKIKEQNSNNFLSKPISLPN